MLNAGAEKISVNSPALEDPALIDELARRFGSQCVVVGIDSQTMADGFRVTSSPATPTRREHAPPHARVGARGAAAWRR